MKPETKTLPRREWLTVIEDLILNGPFVFSVIYQANNTVTVDLSVGSGDDGISYAYEVQGEARGLDEAVSLALEALEAKQNAAL